MNENKTLKLIFDGESGSLSNYDITQLLGKGLIEVAAGASWKVTSAGLTVLKESDKNLNPAYP
jgi:hypothetical protein